tara:strand:+ start:527 stop:1720 length:1194 start_codon:yes stop_codon:yes gene_type:complete
MKEFIKLFNQYVDDGLYPGIEWKISLKKQTFEGNSGYLNIENKLPIVENTIYRIWSMTKPIISIVILQLIEENKLKLNDSITKFLPKFDNLKVLKSLDSNIDDLVEIKQMPTIENLLCHTAGFSYNFIGDAIGRKYENLKLFHSELTSLEEEIDILASVPLLCQPSTKWIYSVSVDILARIIEIITNSSLQIELKKRIFDPLEMNHTSFNVDVANYDNLMTQYEFDSINKRIHKPSKNKQKIFNYGYPINQLSYSRGGHGLFSTLNDYFKFAQMLLTGKNQYGKTIISNALLTKATTNQLNKKFFPLEIINFDEDNSLMEENGLENYGWGLGFRVMQEISKFENIGNTGEFGWSGAASTYFLVDPKYDLVAVMMTQVLGANNNLQKEFYKQIYKTLI